MSSTPSPADVAIRTTELVKRYSPTGPPALNSVDVEVSRGSFLSVMGPSGSGKSTLLHLVGGLDRPSEGQVELDGTNLATLDDSALTEVRRTRIGFVFQAFNLVPVLSAADNIALGAVISGLGPGDYESRLSTVLDLVGLSAHREKLPSEMSGGEQQRVAIARALLLEPPLVLADEPTGNLDSVTGDSVLELLRRANTELGTTILMVTHDARAAAVADGVIALNDGQITSTLELDSSQPHDARAAAVLAFLGADRQKARAQRSADDLKRSGDGRARKRRRAPLTARRRTE